MIDKLMEELSKTMAVKDDEVLKMTGRELKKILKHFVKEELDAYKQDPHNGGEIKEK